MRPVGVGVGQDHDLAVAAVLWLERRHHSFAYGLFLAAHGDQDALDLGVLPNSVVARPEDIEDLPSDGQHGLEGLVPGVAGGAQRRVAFYDEKFAAFYWEVLQAVFELARQGRLVENSFFPFGICPASRQSGVPCLDAAAQDGLGIFLVALVPQPVREGGVHEGLDGALGLGVVQLVLGLALELGVGELYRHRRGETFPNVLGVEGLLLVLLEPAAFVGVAVKDAGECSLQALDMGTAVNGRDHVGKRVGTFVLVGLAVPCRPLQGHLDRDGLLENCGSGWSSEER